MTDRPADARAFSRPAPKAREKRPGDEVDNRPQSSARVSDNSLLTYNFRVSDERLENLWEDKQSRKKLVVQGKIK